MFKDIQSDGGVNGYICQRCHTVTPQQFPKVAAHHHIPDGKLICAVFNLCQDCDEGTPLVNPGLMFLYTVG